MRIVYGESDTCSGPPIDSGASTGLWWRGRRILSLVTRFFLGQGALQGINILVGLYLVRVLSIESYAQFGLTVGFQQTVGLLMDSSNPLPDCRWG
jgi:hypothetical protein